MKKFSIYTTAALMALASNFAGCSSDGDGSVAGNSSEETGIIALGISLFTEAIRVPWPPAIITIFI